MIWQRRKADPMRSMTPHEARIISADLADANFPVRILPDRESESHSCDNCEGIDPESCMTRTPTEWPKPEKIRHEPGSGECGICDAIGRWDS